MRHRCSPLLRVVHAAALLAILTTAPQAFAQPPAPSSCSASDDRVGAVLVSWQPVPGAFHYRVYRDGELVAFIPAPATSYSEETAPGAHEYCVRAYGEGGEGPACCDAGTMIPVASPAPCNASDDSKAAVTVTWSAVNGVDGYRVYRDGSLIGSVSHPTTSYVDVPTPGTRQYCVRAYQGLYVSEPACDAGTMVAIDDPGPCTATDDSPDHVVITWTAVTDATHYEVTRNNVTIAVLPSPATSYQDTPPVGTFFYCVNARVQNVAGPTCCATGRRVEGPPPPPATPAQCATEQIGESTIRLTWQDVLFEGGYRVYRDDVLLATLSTNVTLFQDTNPGLALHEYCVLAFRDALVSEPCCAEGVILVTPGPCAASDDDTTQVTFQWTDVENEDGYRVIRDGEILAEVPANSASYTDAPPLGPHVYCVRALRGERRSDACCDGGIMKPVPPPPPPAAPAQCHTAQVGGSAIRFSWTDVDFEEGYRVFRDDALLATLPEGSSFYDDLDPGSGSHIYCVRSYQGDFVSDPCCAGGIALATPAPCAASDDDTTQVTFTWGDVAGETSYRITRDGQMLLDVAADVTSITDTPPPGTHTYCVRALSGEHGSNACCDNGTMTPAPPPPPTTATQRLSWGSCDPPVENTFFHGPDHYRLVSTVTGLGDPMIGYDLTLNIYPSIPDAWRFDDGGCQTGARLAVSDNAFSKTCPALRGANPLLFSFFGYDPGTRQAQARVVQTYDTFIPEPSRRYTMITWDFDHAFSVVGPTEPGVSCGNAQFGLEFSLLTTVLLQSGNVYFLSAQASINSGPVGTKPTTLGRLKALYR